MEIVLERLHRVEHRGRPIADPRIQTSAGGDQQWEAGAGLLVADPNIASFVERHGGISFLNGSIREFSPIFVSAQPRCADFCYPDGDDRESEKSWRMIRG